LRGETKLVQIKQGLDDVRVRQRDISRDHGAVRVLVVDERIDLI
jgi:hypothetical protein